MNKFTSNQKRALGFGFLYLVIAITVGEVLFGDFHNIDNPDENDHEWIYFTSIFTVLFGLIYVFHFLPKRLEFEQLNENQLSDWEKISKDEYNIYSKYIAVKDLQPDLYTEPGENFRGCIELHFTNGHFVLVKWNTGQPHKEKAVKPQNVPKKIQDNILKNIKVG